MNLMNTYTISDVEAFLASKYAGWNLYIAPYSYPVSFTGLAQGQSQSAILSITANADFLHLETLYRASIGAAETVSNKTAAFVRMLVTDTGTNERWTESAIDLENYATNGASDRAVYYPRLIQGRTTLQISVTNWAPVAQTYALELSFKGVQVKALNRIAPPPPQG